MGFIQLFALLLLCKRRFLPFTFTSQRGEREQELKRAGHCTCNPLRPGRTFQEGKGDFQEYKWHSGTWAGVGTQVNAYVPAVLLNVFHVKSRIALYSFFPVFIFRLARPVCSHLHGNVRENYFVSFLLILLLKAQLTQTRPAFCECPFLAFCMKPGEV